MAKKHLHTKLWCHGELPVIECDCCGFRHLDPLPTDVELKEIYEKEFGGRVRGDFKNRKEEDRKYWEMAFGRRLATYKRLLRNKDDSRTRILDVGCGTGNLLQYFHDHGWDIFGIEPSEHFADGLEALGIPYLSKLTSEISSTEWKKTGQFDVINMSMLLEHIRDPHALVEEMVARLKPGGVMTIESPNDFNPFQVAAAEAHGLSHWWINPLHLNYFDFKSLERLLTCHGLRPTVRDAQFPLEMFLLFGDVYVGDGELGRECHHKRVKFEQTLHDLGEMDLLGAFYQEIAKLGLGRTLIVHGMKKDNE